MLAPPTLKLGLKIKGEGYTKNVDNGIIDENLEIEEGDTPSRNESSKLEKSKSYNSTRP